MIVKIVSWISGSLPKIVQWSIPSVLFNFCTILLNHPVYNNNMYENEKYLSLSEKPTVGSKVLQNMTSMKSGTRTMSSALTKKETSFLKTTIMGINFK